MKNIKYPEEYSSSSTPLPEGDQDDDDNVLDNPLNRTFSSLVSLPRIPMMKILMLVGALYRFQARKVNPSRCEDN